MGSEATSRAGGTAARLVALAVVATVLAACGGASGGTPEGKAGATAVPRSLRAAESAAEDTIDLAVAGKRDKAIKSAAALKDLADGQLAEDLTAVATGGEISELQERARQLARIAPDAEPIPIALAANRAFELIAGFFGRYQSEVPGAVMLLDYLDFEAKLQTLAHDMDGVRPAVERLATTWAELHDRISSERGGAAAATAFDTHVTTMRQLAGGTDFTALADEAQHGLDLVDDLEAVYSG